MKGEGDEGSQTCKGEGPFLTVRLLGPGARQAEEKRAEGEGAQEGADRSTRSALSASLFPRLRRLETTWEKTAHENPNATARPIWR